MIFVEYSVFTPFPTERFTVPPYFRALAAREDVRAVYDAPAQHILARMEAMALQLVHTKPLIAAQLYRRPPQNAALLALLDAAILGQGGALAPPPSEALPALARVAEADRVILHKHFVAELSTVLARLERAFGAAVYEDADVAVYAVPPTAPLPSTYWVTDEAWTRLAGGAALLTAESGFWHFYTPDPFGELRVTIAPVGRGGRIGVALDGRVIGAWWADEGTLRIPIWADAGFHTLRLTALDGCVPYPFAAECVSAPLNGRACAEADPPLCLSVALGAPSWQPQPEPQPLDVRLGEGLRLRGWTLDVDEAARQVRVRLFWEAQGALSADYALFVHLAEPQTARPLAQFDGFPSLPTSAWREGARWVSDVTLNVPPDVPAGEYALNVGWFVPQTGARLSVQSARRWSDDGIIYLGPVTLR